MDLIYLAPSQDTIAYTGDKLNDLVRMKHPEAASLGRQWRSAIGQKDWAEEQRIGLRIETLWFDNFR